MPKRDMLEGWNDRVINLLRIWYLEQVGVREKQKKNESISLQGKISGKNDFFVLKECPPVLSLRIQVDQHRRGFMWLQDQMPYLVKADRIESAKIYASEVRENVPVIIEQVKD